MREEIEMEYTRTDYLDGKCTHKQYYAQYVTNSTVAMVVRHIGAERLVKSTDEHLNDIALKCWDSCPIPVVGKKMESLGDYLTLSGRVCIAKEAARQYIRNEL